MEEHPVAYNEIIDFLLGGLDKERTAQVVEHLGICTFCTGRLNRFVKLRQLARESVMFEPPPGLVAKAKAIPLTHPRQERFAWLRLKLPSPALAFASGFAAALVLFVSLSLYVADQDIAEDSVLYPVVVNVKGLQIGAARAGEYFGFKRPLTSAFAPVTPPTGSTPPPSFSIVISQVYGGGGNSGARLTSDFVELFNLGDTTVSLEGWSLQYAAASGTSVLGGYGINFSELRNLSIAPGQYLLIRGARGNSGFLDLPAPDFVPTTLINFNSSSGKIALVKTATFLGCNGNRIPCSSAQLGNIVDMVGYGFADFFAGIGPAPEISNATALIRKNGGCLDTKNNAADFVVGEPKPRNSASLRNVCPSTAKP